MLDRYLRPLIDPPLNRAGAALAGCGVGANMVTGLGALLALAAGASLALSAPLLALGLILASRLADGLDGAVARAARARAGLSDGDDTGGNEPGGEDLGGYLDILADFVFYASIPLGFVLADPAANGAAGAFLLAAFYVNAASFLGYAALAEKRRLRSEVNGRKSFFHATGLLEGTETIMFFVLLCLWPAGFVPLAWGFGALCLLTVLLRLVEARARFGA